MIRVVAILCCISVLAGCAAFSTLGAPGASGAPSARENRESRQVIELIAYTQRVAALQADEQQRELNASAQIDRKSTRLNSSHSQISYAVFCLKKKNNKKAPPYVSS